MSVKTSTDIQIIGKIIHFKFDCSRYSTIMSQNIFYLFLFTILEIVTTHPRHFQTTKLEGTAFIGDDKLDNGLNRDKKPLGDNELSLDYLQGYKRPNRDKETIINPDLESSGDGEFSGDDAFSGDDELKEFEKINPDKEPIDDSYAGGDKQDKNIKPSISESDKISGYSNQGIKSNRHEEFDKNSGIDQFI